MSTKDLYDYKYFKASKYYQTDLERMSLVLLEIAKLKPKRVLDVGCGWGTLVEILRLCRIKAVGIDYAPDLRSIWRTKKYFKVADAKAIPSPKKWKYDVVISMDFWEHIPEEDIDQVLSEMKRVGKVILAVIDFERQLTEEQEKYHVTNKSKTWWTKKLKGVRIL